MLQSLSLIILIGLAFAYIASRMKLPRIIGLLIAGIVIGPYALNLLDSSILSVSSELRQIALIIILIKAGLSLNLSDLKKVGRSAVLLSFLPACFEIAAYVIFAPLLLGISRIDAAVMGSVLAAVSPAVVVPRMVKLIEEKRGTDKSIPQMLLAGASCDDVFVIVIFSTFTNMAQGESVSLTNFLDIPISVGLGMLLGAISGFALSVLFETAYTHHRYIRNSMKVIILMGSAFLLMSVESLAEGIVPISGLLAVVTAACMLKMKCAPSVVKRLSEKTGKLWLAAEIFLFVLVGAAVDIRYTVNAGASVVAMIFTALLIRAAGVAVCLIGTGLTPKEKIFCVISYLPKATVQAAIGSVPLSMGLGCGDIVLSTAVLGILITAPLGAVGIDATYKKLLKKDE